MNQVSLVKYNTPTLVSTTGDKKNKKKGNSNIEKKTTQTEDILNSILPPRWLDSHEIQLRNIGLGNGLKMDSYGFNMSLAHQPQDWRWLIYKSNLIINYNKDKHEKLEFVRFVKSYIHNALVSKHKHTHILSFSLSPSLTSPPPSRWINSSNYN